MPINIAAMSGSKTGKRQLINMRNNRTSFGELNNERVEFLRDTGSSVSIVRSALMIPEQYTGKQITCLLLITVSRNVRRQLLR